MNRMKTFFSIISPVLPVSIIIFLVCGLAAGSVGPCGPSGPNAGWYFMGYPIRLIGILVGLWRTATNAIRYYNQSRQKQQADKDVS